MSSVLIVYASNHGHTFAITDAVARELRSLGLEVTTKNALEGGIPAPDAFDVVVLGSRIELGRHASAIVGYLHQYGAVLRAMPTAFFSVSMSASNGGADPNGYLDATFSRLGWRPTVTAAIAGGLAYRQYNFLLRFVMKQISKSAGHTTDTSRDHVFTDWNQVHNLATDIAKLAHSREQSHAS